MNNKVWSQGAAGRSLSGRPTMNPGPAATALLGRSSGKRKFQRALKRAGKHRRSAHRGNPLPAVVGTVLGGLGSLGGRFKQPSEKRAAGAAATLVAAAVAGNLTAAKAIAERTEIGIKKERAVWRKAFLQVPKEIVAAVAKYADKIPGVDHSGPEAAAESALARAVDVHALVGAATTALAARGVAAERRAALAAAAAERREERLTGLAGTAAQALLGRGRRPRARRRKARRVSF